MGTEEAVAFAQFLATLTSSYKPLLTERHGQVALQAMRSAMRRRYICRSQRKPLNVGKGRTFDHVFYRNQYGP